MEVLKAIIFNRETEDKVPTTGSINFDLKSRRTRIDQAGVIITQAKQGMYVHFLQIDDIFYLVINDDNKGYLLSGISERNGLATSNVKFIRHFFIFNKIREEKSTWSLIAADGKEWKGSPMYEIFKKTAI